MGQLVEAAGLEVTSRDTAQGLLVRYYQRHVSGIFFVTYEWNKPLQPEKELSASSADRHGAPAVFSRLKIQQHMPF